jgi:hypothetical protein
MGAGMSKPSKARKLALSWPAEKFRGILGAALVAASSDTDRPHLCGVRIRRENSTVTVDATDGTWALRWREVEGASNEMGDANDRKPFECVIPRRVAECFLAATKKPLELERCTLTCDETPYELATILDVRKHEFLPVPEAFAPIDSVIPTTVSPECAGIGVAAAMLARVAKAFALAVGEADAIVYWQFSGGKESPLLCTSPKREELLAVVMPVRDGDENALPEAAE